MAVLSNRALVEALDTRRLVIDPRPEPPPGQEQTPFDTGSVDLHLSPDIYVPRKGLRLTFDLQDQGVGRTLDAVYERAEIPERGWVLPPHQLVLGRTIERVELPLGGTCLAARIEGRSSFARTGLLVHFTAPTIHPGFEGSITLEMINLGEIPLTLRPRLPVCQLIVETVEGSPIRKESQFHGQARPIG
jgi:dCTP deaminase